MADGDVVLTRDLSSGRVHKRIRNGGRLMIDERCNLDDAGAYMVIDAAAVADADASSLCRFCFPEPVVTV